MYRKIIQKLQPVLYKGIKWYYAKPRIIRKRGLTIHLLPSVFHPGLYLSTDIFLDFILTLPITGKRVLELGAGNGFVSLYLAKNKNCRVTSSDINPKAVEGLLLSAKANDLEIDAVESNLFDQLSNKDFDYIFVNPPYYPKSVSTADEHAFFCGEKFEYFHRFFPQILPRLKSATKAYVILSESAPIEKIEAIAIIYGVSLNEIFRQRKNSEDFMIYMLAEL